MHFFPRLDSRYHELFSFCNLLANALIDSLKHELKYEAESNESPLSNIFIRKFWWCVQRFYDVRFEGGSVVRRIDESRSRFSI